MADPAEDRSARAGGPRTEGKRVNCEECRELIQDLVDNELPPTVRTAVEGHLKTCTVCDGQYREQARFTTSVVKAVQPLKPSAEFSSKVLATYEGTKAQLKAAPPPVAKARVPRWPFIAAAAVLVVAGVAVLLWPSASDAVGRITRNAAQARILTHSDGGWKEVDRAQAFRSGCRIVALAKDPKAPGPVVVVELKPTGEAWLLAPCGLQVEREPQALVLRVLQESAGRVRLVTGGGATGTGPRVLRMVFGAAWTEVNCAEKNSVDVEPNTTTGELLVSVQSGAARLGNAGVAQTVAEGFAGRAAQSGPCPEASKVAPSAFDWATAQTPR
jgi:hypothetical protein